MPAQLLALTTLCAALTACRDEPEMQMPAPAPPPPPPPVAVEATAPPGSERPAVGAPMSTPAPLIPDRPGLGGSSEMTAMGMDPVAARSAPPGVPLPPAPKDPGSVTWNRWRGPHHNGISHETDWICEFPRSGPKILWRQRIGVGFSSLSVADERVYTMSNDGGRDLVLCLDAEKGTILWSSGYPADLAGGKYEGGPSATPTVHQGRVYTLGKAGQMLCLDARTGKTVWTRKITDLTGIKAPRYGFAGSPLILGDQVILNAGAAGAAFQKDTGTPLWTSRGVGGYASPVPFQLGGRPSVLLFGQRNLIAVDPASSGRSLWGHPWKTEDDVNAADPIIVRDRIFASSGYGAGCAMFQLINGAPRHIWQSKALRSHFNPGVALGNFVYGIDGQATGRANNSLVCVNLATGRRMWERQRFGFGSLIAAGGRLIVLTELGELIILEANPHAYTELAYARVLGKRCWTTPALSGGRLYARTAKGSAVCVDLRPEEPEPPEVAKAGGAME